VVYSPVKKNHNHYSNYIATYEGWLFYPLLT